MILEKEYSVFYWLDVQLTPHEFEIFTKELDKVKIPSLIDGIDIEGQSICFRFNQCKPTKPQEVKWAKEMNKRNCNKFMQLLSKRIDGRLYFNVNHRTIKRK